MAGPGIVLGKSGSACPHGVQVNVPNQFEQIRIRIDQKSFVPSLEKMAGPGLGSVDPFGEAQGDVLHDPGQRNIAHLHHQMDMVSHQAKGMNTTAEFFDGILEDQIKAIAVPIVRKNRVARAATEHDVVKSAGEMNTGLTRHGRKIAQMSECQT
jgi:hypothetical protein